MKRADEEPTPKAIENALTQDPLQRKREIEDFLKMLIAVEPPYTFVIDAPWGSGKTFFVKQVARVLQMANPALDINLETLNATLGETATELPATPCLPIYFNAWEDDHFENPILPILASIANAADEQSVKGGKDFGKELRGKIDELIKTNLPEVADRAIIFIDELDRCRPEFAIKVLEQTKTLFQQDNIVVVYSTDITQLAHSLQGVYGPRFDGRKYLERFYDKRLELNPIKPADYLLYKGINTMDGYTFMDITIDLLGYKQASLRACNRLIDSITNLSRYIANHWEHFGNGRVQHFPDQGLLPVVNILAYYDPLAWHEMKTSTGYEAVYELAKHSDHFIQYLDEVIESVWGANKDELPYKQDIENRRKRFVEDLSALIYGNNDRDPRVKELGNSELTRMSFNQQLYQRLAPPL